MDGDEPGGERQELAEREIHLLAAVDRGSDCASISLASAVPGEDVVAARGGRVGFGIGGAGEVFRLSQPSRF